MPQSLSAEHTVVADPVAPAKVAEVGYLELAGEAAVALDAIVGVLATQAAEEVLGLPGSRRAQRDGVGVSGLEAGPSDDDLLARGQILGGVHGDGGRLRARATRSEAERCRRR